jgi:hypothetical protein
LLGAHTSGGDLQGFHGLFPQGLDDTAHALVFGIH